MVFSLYNYFTSLKPNKKTNTYGKKKPQKTSLLRKMPELLVLRDQMVQGRTQPGEYLLFSVQFLRILLENYLELLQQKTGKNS
jgi:hypothetical protein